MPFGHGDDDARVRERRGTTPLTHTDGGVRRSYRLCRALPVRFYWALRRLFFRKLPGDSRIDAPFYCIAGLPGLPLQASTMRKWPNNARQR